MSHATNIWYGTIPIFTRTLFSALHIDVLPIMFVPFEIRIDSLFDTHEIADVAEWQSMLSCAGNDVVAIPRIWL